MTLQTETPPIAEVAAASFQFGKQQEAGRAAVKAWYQGIADGTDHRQVFRLFGVAGTGKTTLARHLAEEINGNVYFAAFTGKAALVLQKSGCPGACTLHSLLYKAKRTSSGGVVFKLNKDSRLSGAKLLVIDECSMVDQRIARDLLSFKVPILVLGDPAQLPPVKGKGYFTDAKPDVMLTEIHRQARGNPIIRLATDVREGRDIAYGAYGSSVVIDRPGKRDAADLLAADQVIVGRNQTRKAFNARLRAHLGFTEPTPRIGDRLVCLRNDPDAQILNGELFEVAGYRPAPRSDLISLDVKSEDAPERGNFPVRIHPSFFDGNPDDVDWRELKDTQQFDYGYALTGHKSQGSQWGHVMAYDEGQIFGADARRWLYTVITRASEKLTLIR